MNRNTFLYFTNKHDNREDTHLSWGKSMKKGQKVCMKSIKNVQVY